MSEELGDFPAALIDNTRYPWDEPLPAVLWQWGADAGRPLTEIASRELVRKRAWLERKQGMGTYFVRLIASIDQVLTDRGGEI